LAKEGHPCLPVPFPLRNFKEQARERRNNGTLPRLCGNAIKMMRHERPRFVRPRNGQNKIVVELCCGQVRFLLKGLKASITAAGVAIWIFYLLKT
jgi:hypothetical protein